MRWSPWENISRIYYTTSYNHFVGFNKNVIFLRIILHSILSENA